MFAASWIASILFNSASSIFIIRRELHKSRHSRTVSDGGTKIRSVTVENRARAVSALVEWIQSHRIVVGVILCFACIDVCNLLLLQSKLFYLGKCKAVCFHLDDESSHLCVLCSFES